MKNTSLPVPQPDSKKTERPVIMRQSKIVVTHFKTMVAEAGMPDRNVATLFLRDCLAPNRKALQGSKQCAREGRQGRGARWRRLPLPIHRNRRTLDSTDYRRAAGSAPHMVCGTNRRAHGQMGRQDSNRPHRSSRLPIRRMVNRRGLGRKLNG